MDASDWQIFSGFFVSFFFPYAYVAIFLIPDPSATRKMSASSPSYTSLSSLPKKRALVELVLTRTVVRACVSQLFHGFRQLFFVVFFCFMGQPNSSPLFVWQNATCGLYGLLDFWPRDFDSIRHLFGSRRTGREPVPSSAVVVVYCGSGLIAWGFGLAVLTVVDRTSQAGLRNG